MNRLLKYLPFIASFIVGIGLFIISQHLKSGFSDLFINLAASFIAIPLIYISYETVKGYSERKLNHEIFDYAKVQIDTEVLSILNTLEKIIYTYETQDKSLTGIKRLCSLKTPEIERLLEEHYLGFQILKEWEIAQNNLKEMLKNPFILEKLDNEAIISIIQILKEVKIFKSFRKKQNLYININEDVTGYRIVPPNGTNLNFPMRYMLLKSIDSQKGIVIDFGDFSKHNEAELLKYFKVNDIYQNELANSIKALIDAINNWVNRTGREFLIDSEMFRIAKHH